MIDKSRRVLLLGIVTLLAAPVFAGVAKAGKTGDSHGQEGGGGGNPEGHDHNETPDPGEPPGNPTNHDNKPITCDCVTQE
jgi:hypothetical protein